MKRPAGNNADEWAVFLEEYGVPGERIPYICVQIAGAIDDAQTRGAAPKSDGEREKAIENAAMMATADAYELAAKRMEDFAAVFDGEGATPAHKDIAQRLREEATKFRIWKRWFKAQPPQPSGTEGDAPAPQAGKGDYARNCHYVFNGCAHPQICEHAGACAALQSRATPEENSRG